MRSSMTASHARQRRRRRRVRRRPARAARGALLALDGLEQRAEVAGPEPLVALALDDLEEERAGFGIVVQAGRLLEEDLQEVLPGLAAVDQDLELAQDLDALVDLVHAQAPQALG